LIPVFLLAGVLGYFLPQVVGSGHDMINLVVDGNAALKWILLLLAAKFLFSIISLSSGAPGGIFFPLLVIGAYVGAAYGHIMIAQFGIDPQYFVNFMIIAMAGYFAAIVRAPITGIILITEMTGSFNHLLAIATVAIVSYITAELLRSTPVYEGLLDRIVSRVPGETTCMTDDKIIVQNIVEANSPIANKRIYEIDWPEDVLLISLKRGRKRYFRAGM
jgi:H+/Cl- antiporter ClcA